MPNTSSHAAVPPDQCGQPLALVTELLPSDARFDCEVIPAPGVSPDGIVLDGFFAELGLPTGRLVVKPGMWLFLDGYDQQWLAVDFIVPGRRSAAGGWDIQFNVEAGRARPDEPGAHKPALDRWTVQLVDGLPDFLEAAR